MHVQISHLQLYTKFPVSPKWWNWGTCTLKWKKLRACWYSVFEIRLSNLMVQKLQNSNIYIGSIKKNWQKSLVRINFHWPWATGPLLKSMTGYLKISSLYTIYSSLTLKYMQCTSIYIFFIQCTSIYIFCITFHFRLLPLWHHQ